MMNERILCVDDDVNILEDTAGSYARSFHWRLLLDRRKACRF